MKHSKHNIAFYSSTLMVLITILTGAFLMSNTASADDTVVDDVVITVPVACSMTGELDTPHTATINPGQSASDIGTTTFQLFCNDNSGYSIYAIGYSNEEYGNTKLLATVGGQLAPTYDIVTGTATSGNTSNWAMKLNPVAGTYAPTITNGFSSYRLVPDTYTKAATLTSSTDVTIGSSLQSTYQAYITGTQPAGTYAGKVKYTLVHPNDANAPIPYNTNADDISEVTYMQEFAKVSNENRDLIIASMVPEQQYTLTDARDGKTYTIAKYAIPASRSSEEYQLAGEYVISCVAGSCDETIYQQLPSDWQIFVDSCNVATESCDMSLWPNIYDVWMTKNLDLDLNSSKTYTNEDTDLGYNTQTGQYESASWTPMRSTYAPTTGHIHEWGQDDPSTPESYNPGELYWNLTESDYSDWDAYYSSCDYNTPTPTCDQSKNPINTYVSSTGTNQYHLGNYYNWAAALATNDSSAFIGPALVEQSICPVGWTLPRSDIGEDTFYSLWNQYGFSNSSFNDQDGDHIHDVNEDALWTSPLYFSAGGDFDGVLSDAGGSGGFWSPVPGGSGGAGYAGFGVDGGAVPSGNASRRAGVSVRCVLRPVVTLGSGGGGGGVIIVPSEPGGPII